MTFPIKLVLYGLLLLALALVPFIGVYPIPVSYTHLTLPTTPYV